MVTCLAPCVFAKKMGARAGSHGLLGHFEDSKRFSSGNCGRVKETTAYNCDVISCCCCCCWTYDPTACSWRSPSISKLSEFLWSWTSRVWSSWVPSSNQTWLAGKSPKRGYERRFIAIYSWEKHWTQLNGGLFPKIAVLDYQPQPFLGVLNCEPHPPRFTVRSAVNHSGTWMSCHVSCGLWCRGLQWCAAT